jgi:hypothetical protein
MRGHLRTAAALGFLFLLIAGFYWKLTLSDQYTWLENPDQALQVRPWLDFEARELHAGRLPFWDPYLRGGQSLIGQVQPGLANPLNWPLFAMPLRDGHIPIRTLHWYWVLIHWVAAAFCFWLCRDLGASIGASILGAAIFSLAGLIGHSLTPQFLMSAVWLPVIFLFLARVWRGERPLANAALCGAALGAAFMSGHHNVPIYTTVILGVLWVAYEAGGAGKIPGSEGRPALRIACVATFLVIFGLVSAFQVFPAVEYGRLALRWSGAPEPQAWHDRVPYSVHAEYSLGARGVPGLIFPGLSMHAEAFVGVVALALALSAIALRWRRPEVRLLACVALGGLLLALGRDTPVHRVAYLFVPMVDKARYPAMAIVICEASLAPLAALGLEAWRESPKSKTILLLLSGVAAAIFAIYGGMAILHRPVIDSPARITALVALGLGIVLYWLRGAPAAVLALFLVEALTDPPAAIQRLDRPGSFTATMAAQADIGAFFKTQPGWFRILVDEKSVPYNFGDWYGIEQFDGYAASIPLKTTRILGEASTPRVFGLAYRVAKSASDPAQIEVFQSSSGLKVFRDPRIQQPLWATHETACAQPDDLRVMNRDSNSAVYEVKLGCAGTVVSGDPTSPGWQARVDGRRVRIQEVEGIVRGVQVAAGIHRVEFHYRPGSVYWGAALTVLGLLLASTLHFRSKQSA